MITLDIVLVTAGIVALIGASISDLKTREVPDTISYSMIISGLSLKLIYSMYSNTWSYFLTAVLATGILFGIGLILYYSKQWGGGDVKLLAGIGAIFTTHSATTASFTINLFTNLIVVGAVYSAIWVIYFAIKNWKSIKSSFKENITKSWTRISIITKIVAVALLILLVISKTSIPIILILILLIVFYPYLYFLVKAIENNSMYKIYPLEKLTEGDWLAKEVKRKNKIILSPSATGITKKDIALLKKYKIKKILIKEGIAFVPSIALSVIITLILGNIFFLFI